ncbi:hypothetical protein EQP59_08445 [Ornithobacterium rhinotracheale]|uniref:DUF3828 domain-containing protein n=1 Tax=Ornithobacterium rhinotracheale TaxID=28251 RepID=A0A3R5UYE1_ORNRH|nr:hypothetical protein [Ornithobacterium rhinotracheale]QAR31367.1 hypothetical protein EQP59_08445 [Ornithobacterium rhinotracheale]
MIKKLSFVLFSCLIFGQQSQNLEEKFIKEFYVSYMNDDKIDLSNYMSRSLINKINQAQKTLDFSYITRSQDITNDMLKSIEVKKLSNKWYQVNYYSIFNKDTTFFKIPLKISKGNHLKIVDIAAPKKLSNKK